MDDNLLGIVEFVFSLDVGFGTEGTQQANRP
jgi:hypothetical protein